ncbi:MAG: tetratricopeptide repeat protein [Acidobacteriota bacterium]
MAHRAAAMLLSDITGFTALTEALQAGGREGAEEIAATVSAAFAPAIRAIERVGGSIVSFGGDALFAVFFGPSRVRRAHDAALDIASAFANLGDVHTSSGVVRLAISQAVHHGNALDLQLGTATRRHALVTGPSVAALVRLEERIGGGEIGVSIAARRRLAVERRARPARRRRRPVPRAALESFLDPRLVPLLAGAEGEYRRVAILFLETKSFAPAVLQRFFMILTAATEATDGVLLKSDLSAHGTKWLCAFGIPRAHEDDAERAARAALEALAASPRNLAVRAGLHAGTVANVVVGTRRRRCYDVMGDVVNTAARALAQASWGEILTTGEVRRMAAGLVTEPRGARMAKGKALPIELHAVTGARAAKRRRRVSAPMVGRDGELAAIAAAIACAARGEGGAIAIRGEAGMGKSRLKHEAAAVARASGFAVHEGRALSFGGSAYGAIALLLRDALDLPEVVAAGDALAGVRAALDARGTTPADRHHLAEVLGVRFPGSPIEQLRPRDVRINTMIAIRTMCLRLAAETPRLFVLEDMHWADGASAEAAAWLARASGKGRSVLLLIARPGYEPPPGAEIVTLSDLDGDAISQLIASHVGRVPEQAARIVRDRAGGNPFYIEELLNHLQESGVLVTGAAGYELARELDGRDLPDGVEAVIAARIDRLPADAKRVAQYGSVIGRSFLYAILARFGEIAPRARDAVAELCRRELTLEKHPEPRLEYTFKHALTQEVAHRSILAARRRELHRAVADAIEELFGRDGLLAALGHHREQAGQTEEARRAYSDAAHRALGAFAHEEAERLYRACLALSSGPSPLDVAVRNALGERVLQLRGRMEEAALLHRQALDEARALGLTNQQGLSIRSLAHVLRHNGRMEEARDLYQQALAIARQTGDLALEGRTLNDLGNLRADLGDMAGARECYEQVRAIAGASRNPRLEGSALGNLALVYHDEGRMETARGLYEAAREAYRRAGELLGESTVLDNLANLHRDQGRPAEARALYDRALDLHRELGDRRSEGIVLANLAGLNLIEGRFELAGQELDQALAIARDFAFRRFEGFVLGELASHALLSRGDAAAASDLAAAGERLLVEAGDRLELGSLHCIGGHAQLASGVGAAPMLDRVRAIVLELGVTPQSELAKRVSRLERAQDAFQRGAPLVRGHLAADLTAAQLEAIASGPAVERRRRGSPAPPLG